MRRSGIRRGVLKALAYGPETLGLALYTLFVLFVVGILVAGLHEAVVSLPLPALGVASIWARRKLRDEEQAERDRRSGAARDEENFS